jgi:phytanoyl-CoA hydroxylase
MAPSETDVARYVDDGFLVVPGLVSRAEVERSRDDALRFARGEYPVANLPDLPESAGDEERLGAILAVHFPHWVSEVALDLVRHPGVVSVLSRITGAHLAHWDGRVKCMQSMLFLKPPGLQGQAWHQDERYIPTRDRSLVGAWIALDDANVDNGCLWVLPGSHRSGVIWPTREHGRPDEFDVSDEAYGFDAQGAVPVPVAAGDVVFFNGYLLHRSLRNRSDQKRRALVNHYMSGTSLLPWGLGSDVATRDFRNVVLVAGDDPYPWKELDEPPRKTFVRPHEGSW